VSRHLPADTNAPRDTVHGHSDAEHRRHDALLMQMLLRVAPMTALVNIGIGLLTDWLVYPVIGWSRHMTWPLGLSVMALGYVVDSRRHLALPLERLARPAARWRYIGHALLLGMMYSGVATFVFPTVGPDLQFLLGMTSCATIPIGAMVNAPVRTVAVTWIATTATGALIGVLSLAPFMRNVSVGLLLGMVLVVLTSVRSISSGVRARLQAETTAQRDRQALDLLLRDFETHADDWIWETDAQGHLLHVSRRLAQALGLAADSPTATHRLIERLGTGTPAPAALAALAGRLALPQPFRALDVPFETLAGEPGLRVWSFSGVPVLDGDGRLQGWRGLVRDVTVLQAQARELDRLAHTDPLTGLANRHVFQRCCQDTLAAGVGRKPSCLSPWALSICLLDLDNFKTVNDTFGHLAGDRLLQEVARRLSAHVPDGGVLARLGGDEFALLLCRPHDTAGRDALAAALLAALRPVWHTASMHLEIRASLGVASWSPVQSDMTAERLLQEADIALYEAKAAGRDTVRLFDDSMRGRATRRAVVIRDLGALLAAPARATPGAGRLLLHYQPQYNLLDGRLVGAEALLRWQHPQRGWIPPDEFVPIAEETGLILPLGAWVLEQACRDAAAWPVPLGVAVNLSAVQLVSRELAEVVATTLQRTGLPAGRLELEITETALMRDPERAIGCVQGLRDLGLGIALDDFGTGYSSLAQLASLPIDTLKIDRGFVAGLGRPGADQAEAIVRLIVQLGRAVGMVTLAEGVETDAQRDVLRACGCHQVQGHLYGSALDPQAFTALLGTVPPSVVAA
jgi:diguanylate cyclase (GGDEF)-like protein